MTVDDIAYTITADPLLFNDVTQAELDTGDPEKELKLKIS